MANTAHKWQVNQTAASDVDYTSISTNPDVLPVATPREGGFTLRNRWNAAKISSSSTSMAASFAKATANITARRFRIIEVPAQTYVHQICLRTPSASDPPVLSTTIGGKMATDSNAFDTSLFIFGGAAWKEAAQTNLLGTEATEPRGAGVAGKQIGNWLGAFDLTVKTAAVASLPTVSASTPWTQMQVPQLYMQDSSAINTSTVTPHGMGFPYGGYVTMFLGPDDLAMGSVSSITSSSAVAIAVSGQWDVVARCTFMPE
jgi:hypothetical protein